MRQFDSAGVEERLLSELYDFHDKLILEIGCGTGRLTKMIKRDSTAIIAVDQDASRVSIARQNLPGVVFLKATLPELSFPAYAFDLVLFSMSLHHMEDEDKILAALQTAASFGKEVLVVEPSIDSDVTALVNLFGPETAIICSAKRVLAYFQKQLRLRRKVTIETQWKFDCLLELFDYFWGKNDSQEVMENRNQVRRFLGRTEKEDSNPLILVDKINYYLF